MLIAKNFSQLGEKFGVSILKLHFRLLEDFSVKCIHVRMTCESIYYITI